MHELRVAIDLAARSSVIFSITLLVLGSAAVSGARAQEVVNPSFELPVAGPPTYYIVDPPTTAGVGWEFSGNKPDVSGVQHNSTVSPPTTTDGVQFGWIESLGEISQKIDFAKGGDYELSFKISGGGAPAEPVAVELGAPLGTFTPPNASFTPVTVPFQITSGTHTLKFKGTVPFANGNKYVSIDSVAIKPVKPEITKGPDGDLDPYSVLTLTVKNAGKDMGKVRIHFPSSSAVTFDNSTSKNNLDLETVI
jgi:Protein of unknown function (DUF642)